MLPDRGWRATAAAAPKGETLLAFARTAIHWGIDEFDVVSQNFIFHHTTLRDGRWDQISVPFRYVWPAELDLMAQLAGLSPKARWGNWRREPFTGMSERHVSVWRSLDRRLAHREGKLTVLGTVIPSMASDTAGRHSRGTCTCWRTLKSSRWSYRARRSSTLGTLRPWRNRRLAAGAPDRGGPSRWVQVEVRPTGLLKDLDAAGAVPPGHRSCARMRRWGVVRLVALKWFEPDTRPITPQAPQPRATRRRPRLGTGDGWQRRSDDGRW